MEDPSKSKSAISLSTNQAASSTRRPATGSIRAETTQEPVPHFPAFPANTLARRRRLGRSSAAVCEFCAVTRTWIALLLRTSRDFSRIETKAIDDVALDHACTYESIPRIRRRTGNRSLSPSLSPSPFFILSPVDCHTFGECSGAQSSWMNRFCNSLGMNNCRRFSPCMPASPSPPLKYFRGARIPVAQIRHVFVPLSPT